jgi:hypothetical protein
MVGAGNRQFSFSRVVPTIVAVLPHEGDDHILPFVFGLSLSTRCPQNAVADADEVRFVEEVVVP